MREPPDKSSHTLATLVATLSHLSDKVRHVLRSVPFLDRYFALWDKELTNRLKDEHELAQLRRTKKRARLCADIEEQYARCRRAVLHRKIIDSLIHYHEVPDTYAAPGATLSDRRNKPLGGGQPTDQGSGKRSNRAVSVRRPEVGRETNSCEDGHTSTV